MCGIKSSKTTVQPRSYKNCELRQHLLEILSDTRTRARETGTSYLLEYVTLPSHLIDSMDCSRSVPETGTLGVKSGENQVERGTSYVVQFLGGLPPQRLDFTPTYSYLHPRKKEREEGRGRHDPPPRSSE